MQKTIKINQSTNQETKNTQGMYKEENFFFKLCKKPSKSTAAVVVYHKKGKETSFPCEFFFYEFLNCVVLSLMFFPLGREKTG